MVAKPPKTSTNLFWQIFSSVFTVIFGYIKAQLIYFIINLVLLTIFLWIFGLPVPFLIALGIAILDTLPIIGSGLVFIPWTITCFVLDNNLLGGQLALLYIGLVVLRQVTEPLIVGHQVGLGPLVTLVASLAGFYFLGFAGIIIGPLIAAVFSLVYRARNGMPPKKAKKEIIIKPQKK